MKAGWKNRIEERRYFEEKKALAKQKPKLNAYEQILFEKQQELMRRPYKPTAYTGKGYF